MSEKRHAKNDAKNDKILDAQKGVDRDAPAESGTLAVVPGNTPISKDILRIGTILGKKITRSGEPHMCIFFFWEVTV